MSTAELVETEEEDTSSESEPEEELAQYEVEPGARRAVRGITTENGVYWR